MDLIYGDLADLLMLVLTLATLLNVVLVARELSRRAETQARPAPRVWLYLMIFPLGIFTLHYIIDVLNFAPTANSIFSRPGVFLFELFFSLDLQRERVERFIMRVGNWLTRK